MNQSNFNRPINSQNSQNSQNSDTSHNSNYSSYSTFYTNYMNSIVSNEVNEVKKLKLNALHKITYQNEYHVYNFASTIPENYLYWYKPPPSNLITVSGNKKSEILKLFRLCL